jgi:hypothetical protein
MTRWEYRVEALPMPAQYREQDQDKWAYYLEKHLSEVGAEGWELVALVSDRGVFKRLVQNVSPNVITENTEQLWRTFAVGDPDA